MLLIITTGFILLYGTLILYYFYHWLRTKEFSADNTPPIFISVVVAARNEEKNIGHLFKMFQEQTYPPQLFEVIIVDDFSTDKTQDIILDFLSDRYHVIRPGTEAANSSKKKALEAGVQRAKGDLIVITDADCIPKKHWLQSVASFHQKTGAVFIAAPVRLKSSNSFLGIFQSLDFITLQGITAASVTANVHSMCNGANLAYEKKGFYEVNGFEGIDEIASGDDMLLMDKFQKLYPDRILFLKSPEVIVETQPAASLKDFMNQRIRWASKADKYTNKKIIAVLLLVYVLNAWIFILGISSFFITKAFYIFLAAIGIKIIVELIFLHPVAKFFGKQKLLWWFIPAQPFHVLYTLVAGWLGKFGSYKWKGRKVK